MTRTEEIIYHAIMTLAVQDFNGGWVSIDERLPRIDQFVIWYTKEGHMGIWEIDKDDDILKDVHPYATHWRPLPNNPDESVDDKIMHIVERAAKEIKDIPVYKPGELKEKL